jgi:CheY-like chemotaxis protein
VTAANPLLLVVDDHEENRDLLARRLAKLGYRVLVASDGPEALELVESSGPHLILLDIMMPRMSGIEVLRALRRRRTEIELPVIMASAKSDSEDVVEALELGANDYVTKPLDMPVVVARVEAQLRRARGTEQALKARASGVGPGTVLAERYRIDAAIGSGAFGTVYRAWHRDLELDVAVKVLRRNAMGEAAAGARFRREGISACRVKHPNAVSVLDFGVTEDGTSFLVMELLDGRSLSETLEAEGPLDARRCAKILTSVCHALQAAHEAGVIHRDIKPSNIFLHAWAGSEVVKVLDFGIAKVSGDVTWGQTVTAEGVLIGTPAYMAPERLRAESYDGKSDVYSLGVTFYQMLTGRLPFEGRGLDPLVLALVQLSETPLLPSAVNPHVPRDVEAVVLAAMHKRPEARPTAAELARALATLTARS